MQFPGRTLSSPCQYFLTLWGSSNSGQNLLNYKGKKHAKDKSKTLPGEDWFGFWINHLSKQKILSCLSIGALWLIIFSFLQLKGGANWGEAWRLLIELTEVIYFLVFKEKIWYFEFNVTQNFHAQTSSNCKCSGGCGEKWAGSGWRLAPHWPGLQAVLDKFIMILTTGIYLLRWDSAKPSEKVDAI